MLKTVTKVSGKEISQNVLKSAEAERNLMDKFTKVDLSSLNAACSINKGLEIVNLFFKKYPEPNHLNYLALFKLFMLQNYQIDMHYYEGFSLKLSTLNQYKYWIKTITKDGIVRKTPSTPKSYLRVLSFIRALKKVSKPIMLFSTKNRGDITEALPYMNQAEREFVTGCSQTRYNEIIKNITTVRSVESMKQVKKNKETTDYNLFIQNVDRSVEQLSNMFPSLKPITVELYKKWFLRLRDGNEKGIPQAIINNWKKSSAHNKSIKQPITNSKTVIVKSSTVTSPIYGVYNKQTSEVSNITGSLEFVKGFKAGLSQASLQQCTPFEVVELKFI